MLIISSGSQIIQSSRKHYCVIVRILLVNSGKVVYWQVGINNTRLDFENNFQQRIKRDST